MTIQELNSYISRNLQTKYPDVVIDVKIVKACSQLYVCIMLLASIILHWD